MLYGVVFGFILCAIISIIKGNVDMLIIFLFLAGLYLIPATINETYLKFYNTVVTILQKGGDYMTNLGKKIKQENDNKK